MQAVKAAVLPMRILYPTVFALKCFESLTPVNIIQVSLLHRSILHLLLLHTLTDVVTNKSRYLKAYQG